MTHIKRKGSRSFKDIPNDILKQLNNGEIESANLVEWLAVDLKYLLNVFLKKLKKEKYESSILTAIENLKKQTVTTVNEAIGKHLKYEAKKAKDIEILDNLVNHPSDAVRCWACYFIGHDETLSLADALAQVRILAADSHFGVREISWIALRHRFIADLNESIELLTIWTKDKDENIRRFASEATRPRGVWCAHLDELKATPNLAIAILEELKNDEAKYVQDSVGNWLNDASKTNGKFVIELCQKWKEESETKNTKYIIKKAMRTLDKG